ncbi:hypothetical protein H5410_051325, partial [Solanum commersonii]
VFLPDEQGHIGNFTVTFRDLYVCCNSPVIDYFIFSYSLLGLSISPFFFLHVHQFSLRPREDEEAFGEEQSFTAVYYFKEIGENCKHEMPKWSRSLKFKQSIKFLYRYTSG